VRFKLTPDPILPGGVCPVGDEIGMNRNLGDGMVWQPVRIALLFGAVANGTSHPLPSAFL